jgi:hypothetical protein
MPICRSRSAYCGPMKSGRSGSVESARIAAAVLALVLLKYCDQSKTLPRA